jgi:hypothetical protein
MISEPGDRTATCPLCKKDFLYCEWDADNWWFPHVCLHGKSILTLPRSALPDASDKLEPHDH